ncbi:MAG: O-antigen ligase family protein, partial [Candidatus Omnitrophota bacterium]
PLLKILSPSTHSLYVRYLAEYLASGQSCPISIYAWPTVMELVKSLAYLMIFVTVLGRIRMGQPDEAKSAKADSCLGHYLQLGCLTGILAIGLHSFVDFNLHITANAFYFTLLAALLTGLRLSRRQGGCDIRFLKRITHGIIAAAFCAALFGIVYKFTGVRGKIYWVIPKDGGIFGSYINYDHYAGYMGMASSVAIAMFFGSLSGSSFYGEKGLRYKVLWFSSREATGAIFYLFSSLVMVGALFLSTSRGGILSFGAATTVLFFVMLIRARSGARSRAALAVGLVLSLITLILVWLGPDEWLARFHSLNFVIRSIIREASVLSEIRPLMWMDTLKMIGDFPSCGVGLGCFSHLFPKYRTFSMNWGFLRYAHNDYLQLVAEMGLAGWAFIIAFWAC